MFNKIDFKKTFIFYLTFIYFTAIYYLFKKHSGGLDSTISEWLINYLGGFTRRGLTGQLFIILSNFFELKLRLIIFYFQCVIYFIFLVLIYNYFKNLPKFYIFYLSFFCPLFITYHVAELEILARKEILVFINFLIFLLISENIKLKKFINIYLILTLPLKILIWEPIIFFLPFYILLLIKIKNYGNFLILVTDLLKIFTLSIITIFILIFNNFSFENEKLMCETMKIIYGEHCYMSLGYLDTSIIQNFESLFRDIKVEYIFRYLMIYFIGFFPIFYLLFHLEKKFFFEIKILNKIKVYYLFILVSLPILILFMMGLDWGRWMNIYYFFSFTTVYFLIKNNFYKIENLYLENFNKKFFLGNKYLLVAFFVVFCFGWNPKTLYKGDVASFPGYRVPYNLIKNLIKDFQPT